MRKFLARLLSIVAILWTIAHAVPVWQLVTDPARVMKQSDNVFVVASADLRERQAVYVMEMLKQAALVWGFPMAALLALIWIIRPREPTVIYINDRR